MPLAHTDMILRMATAVVLGGVIGYERGRSDHPAGLRTHILVALASATFMLVSNHFVYYQHYMPNDPVRVDPSRIASGVVIGIGFVGGGAILRTGKNVHGLTTAASLWLVTSIGLASGGGLYVEAAVATAFSLFVLMGLAILEERYKSRVYRHVIVDLAPEGPSRTELIGMLHQQRLTFKSVSYDVNLASRRTRVRLEVCFNSEAEVAPFLTTLESVRGVLKLRVREPEAAAK